MSIGPLSWRTEMENFDVGRSADALREPRGAVPLTMWMSEMRSTIRWKLLHSANHNYNEDRGESGACPWNASLRTRFGWRRSTAVCNLFRRWPEIPENTARQQSSLLATTAPTSCGRHRRTHRIFAAVLHGINKQTVSLMYVRGVIPWSRTEEIGSTFVVPMHPGGDICMWWRRLGVNTCN